MMNQIRFDTLRYFAKAYFNCSMNWSDLENLIDDFMMRENKQIIDDFKNEIDILYLRVKSSIKKITLPYGFMVSLSYHT